jgi:hypothetical protein
MDLWVSVEFVKLIYYLLLHANESASRNNRNGGRRISIKRNSFHLNVSSASEVTVNNATRRRWFAEEHDS